MKTALGDRDVKLSLEITPTASENGGVDAAAGLELTDTELDRLYVPVTAEAAQNLPETLGGAALVPELTTVPVGGSLSTYLLQP